MPLTRRAAEAGHEIVIHSFTHPHFKELDNAAIDRGLRDTQAAVKDATGRAPRWCRAPFLDWDERIAQTVAIAHLYPSD